MPSCEHFCCQDCAKNFFTLVSRETFLFLCSRVQCLFFFCNNYSHRLSPTKTSVRQFVLFAGNIDITFLRVIIEIICTKKIELVHHHHHLKSPIITITTIITMNIIITITIIIFDIYIMF